MSTTSEEKNQLSTTERALLALKDARKKLEDAERAKHEPIAVIGIGCRFPGGANDVDAFWHLLHNGIDAIREVPPDRWDIDQYYDPNPDTPGKTYSRYGGFLDQIDQFDPQFFGISPREAASMDPQQRLLLEVCWEALEYAGQSPEQLVRSRTGVFVGMTQNDYANLRLILGDPQNISVYDSTGNGFCLASGRVSYILGLQGPNMVIDTGCSSSLVTTHLACNSLRSGECDLALAGGVQVQLSPQIAIAIAKTRALAPDGRCKAFDASADGFSRAEGCGIVVLKRLSDALKHNDQILAVIRGSAVNHDGPSSGLTVPNGRSQQAVIKQALNAAKIEPAQIDYVETHGTGTSLGDPIEVQALAAVLREGRTPDNPFKIGAVKTNLGHLEGAAGIAGLIKVVLALQHQEIPPNLHFSTPSPHIPWNDLPVVVPVRPTPWKPGDKSRIAGVSSFGMGGTNAHMILEEAPAGTEKREEGAERPLHILALSAKTEKALKDLAGRYKDYIGQHPETNLADICFTANTGRSHFSHRLTIVAETTDALRKKLERVNIKRPQSGVDRPKIAFLFTGQGSQYAGMGRQFYDTSPTFRRIIKQCDEILRSYLEIPLLSILYPDQSQSQVSSPTSQINETAYTQPALFSIEYALYEVWKSWGIQPSAMMGHSIGEYAAACAAGVFSLEDGLKLIAERGRLMQLLPQDGKMVAVQTGEASVTKLLALYKDTVSIAALNAPDSLVISGKTEDIDTIVAQLHEAEIKTTPLAVSHAFHSPLMTPMLDDFRKTAQTVTYHSPQSNLLSNFTAVPYSEQELTGEYWCRHILQPVRFQACIERLLQEGSNIFVEIGPHPILSGLGLRIVASSYQLSTLWLPSFRKKRSDWEQMFNSLGELYTHSVSVDWQGIDREYIQKRTRVPLPTYPFQRSRYWIESKPPEIQPKAPTVERIVRPVLFALSANSEEALKVITAHYIETIRNQSAPALSTLCEDARRRENVRKNGLSHPYRMGVITESAEQLQEQLAAFIAGHLVPGLISGQADSSHPLEPVFLFSALGSHYSNMGDELYYTSSVFRQAIDACTAIARSHLKRPLPDILYNADINRCAPEEITCAIFSIEYALTELWRHWGIRPVAVMGSSLGEIPAACIAGALNLEDALHLSVSLGQLFGLIEQKGATVAILADEARVEQALVPYAQEASFIVYGGRQNLISGTPGAIQAISDSLQDEGIEVKPLEGLYGLHSSETKAAFSHHKQTTHTMMFTSPHTKVMSGFMGKMVSEEVTGPEYWLRNVLEPVRFSKAIRALVQAGYTTFLEVGPRASLLGMGKNIVESQALPDEIHASRIAHRAPFLWLPSLRRTVPDWQQMLQSLANLYVSGADIRWEHVNQGAFIAQTAPVTVATMTPQKDSSEVIDCIRQGDAGRLSEYLLKTAALSEAEQQLLPKLMELLVTQHQRAVAVHNLPEMLYGIEWREAVLPESLPVSNQAPGTWLIFGDAGGFAQNLTQRLSEQGYTAISLVPGTSYEPASPGIWHIDPTQPGDFSRIFQQLEASEYPPLQGILHAWNLDAPASDTFSLDELDHAQLLGCLSVLYCVQALRKQHFSTMPGLWVVTRGIMPVGQESAPLSVAQAPIWGLGRTLALEYPEIWGGMIDLDSSRDEAETESVLNEIFHSTHEDQIAFRQMIRYVSRLVSQPRYAAAEPDKFPVRTDATYLITGGLGALGLHVAQWLADNGARHLALLGRRGITTDTQRNIIDRLQATGVDVQIFQTDVAEQADMEQRFEQIVAEMPPIKGIFHAAGLTDTLPFHEIDQQKLMDILAPKVRGTWILHQLSRSLYLDLFVNFSSMASVTGSEGQSHYAAANHFQDIVAHERRRQNLPGLSINWGPWAGGGMLSEKGNATFARMGLTSLTPTIGMTVLNAILRADVPQLMVANVDWSPFKALYEVRYERPFFSEVGGKRPQAEEIQVPASASILQQLEAAPEPERSTLLRTYLQAQTAAVLGLPPEDIDAHQSLSNIGFDSLMAIDLKTRLQQDLHVEIPMVKFIDEPTIANLSTHILEQFPEKAPIAETPKATRLSEDTEQAALPLTEQEILTEFPLSYGQQALWFLYRQMPESASYNVAFPIRVRSPLNFEALQQAFRQLIARHPGLRTTFAVEEEKPIQRVHATLPFWFEHADASHWDAEALRQHIIAAYKHPFSLEQGPLLRVHVFTQSPENHVLLIVIHHIVHDGWSLLILMEEFQQVYDVALAGHTASFPPFPATYQDFVQQQYALLSDERGVALWDYWSQQLSGELPILDLPTDHPRPPVRSDHGASFSFVLSDQLANDLKQFARQEGVTLYTLLLAAFQTLLYRYTGQIDVLVGSPTTGRDQLEFSQVINYFVNMIVLRANFEDNPPFDVLLRQIRQTVLDALEHQSYPFSLLVERLRPERASSRTPIFQTVFGLRRIQKSQSLATLMMPRDLGKKVQWGALELEYVDMPQEEGQFDLVLDMIDSSDVLYGVLKYSTDLFEQATIERMTAHFTTLLQGIVAAPDTTVENLPLLTDTEQQQLLYQWNASAEKELPPVCIHELFEAQAVKTPEVFAVVCGQQHLTYSELNARANQLAHYLRHLNFGPESIIGLCVERTCEMIVGMLGVLKAGAAYVPIDPSYPQDRLAFMLDDAAVPLLLTQESLLSRLPERSGRNLCLDKDWDIISQHSPENLPSLARQNNLAYVIYTSGSTGTPKGTLLHHAGLLNLALWHQDAFQVTESDNATQLAGLAFDASVWEVWPYLTIGATLHLIQSHILRSPESLRDWLISQKITISFLPTPLAEEVLALPWPENVPLRIMLTGGDRLRRAPSPGIPFTLINNYGPTENTVVTTSGEIPPSSIPGAVAPHIGRPITNAQVYILDAALQPVPLGVPGELHIGGIGLARGYLNREELTQERFIPHPFDETPGARVYKTGDLVRYLPDGNIEFLGRMDDQVKIRGFRIELGEIEAALSAHPGIRENVVLAREDIPGTKQLVAYLVLTDDAKEVTLPDLRSFLGQRLPEYMVPAAFVFLDVLPITPNGKIDRKALSAPEASRDHLEHEYVAPRTPVEQQLTDIWADVLNLSQVGIHDNFFDLGGDSILSIQILTRANQQGLNLSSTALFQHQTIAELAQVVTQTSTIQAEQGIVTGPMPLTPIQHWFFEQSFVEPHHWNQAVLLEVRQSLDLEHLEHTMQALLHHHDALRLRFFRDQQHWQQKSIIPDGNPIVKVIDLSELPETEQQSALEAEASRLQASLDLNDGPLIQTCLFWLEEDNADRLLIVAHHLAIDGVSWRILLEDLQMAYTQIQQGQDILLPAKTTSFKAWASRLPEYSYSLDNQLGFWVDTLSKSDAPNIPADFPEASLSEANTEACAVHCMTTLGQEHTHALLHKVHQAYNTQINDLLLAALLQACGSWTGSTSLLLTLEGHGREELFDDINISRTIGWFTALFPVWLHAEQLDNPGEAVKSVKEQLRQIPQRGFGYGLLRHIHPDSKIREQMRELPQPQISFNYLGQLDRGIADSGLFEMVPESPGPLHGPQNQRTHLIDINAFVQQGSLHVEWTYSHKLHRAATIETLAQAFLNALRTLIEHCQAPEAGGYTPSDFPDIELKQDQLDSLLESLDLPDMEDTE